MKLAIQNWISMARTRTMVFLDSLKAVDSTPEGQSDRDRLIAELHVLQQRDREEEAAYQLRLNTLGKELHIIDQRADELRQKVNMEHGRRMARSLQSDARITRIRHELEASCPVQVGTFLEKINVEIDHCLRILSPDQKVTHRIAELRRIREQANTLRTAPLPIADVLTQFRSLEHTMATIH